MSAPERIDLSCQELVELVTDYLERRMSVDERSRFEMHLCYCAPCRTYLAQVRATVGAAGRVGEETLPADARDALLAAFRGWRRGPGGTP
jgi:anti-sigma factor RsiW